jgi:hypothetical protein
MSKVSQAWYVFELTESCTLDLYIWNEQQLRNLQALNQSIPAMLSFASQTVPDRLGKLDPGSDPLRRLAPTRQIASAMQA